MLRVGLTGGIACGKSVVAGLMVELGCHVIEADAVAHEVIEPGHPAHEELIRAFGRGILRADGTVDRARLGALVFTDPQKIERLNRIVHPRVKEKIERQLVELNHHGSVEIVVVVAALHLEAGYTDWDRLVVVWCRREQQLERLMARGLTLDEAEARLARQMPIEEKRQLAQERGYDLIDASGSLAETRGQVEALVARFRQLAVV